MTVNIKSNVFSVFLHQFSVVRIPVDVDVHVGALDCGQHQRVIVLIQLCFVTVYYRSCLVIETTHTHKKKQFFILAITTCLRAVPQTK